MDVQLKSELHMELALEATDRITAMLAYWDKDLVCRFANSAYLDWFGRSKEEMIDKVRINELLGPEIFEKNKKYIDAALNGESMTFEREIPLPHGVGSRFALANYFPNVVNGAVAGFFVHVADITTLKHLERDLLISNTTIHEQNKRLLNFANIVTHNLRSYANNLGGILDLFVHARSENERSEMLAFLKKISIGFSATIINLSEIVETQNIGRPKLEQIYLHEYVERAINILQMDIRDSSAVIRNTLSPEITLMSNPAYIDSIILNFLTNAIKYSSKDRIPVIDISATTIGSELLFSIKDNGIGIDLKKHKQDLFGMYKTFHTNADAKGIGLFLVKSQIDALGARVEVESEEGLGTTFNVYFPLS